MQSHTAGAQLGFSDRGCKLLVNCTFTYVKPPFSWFQIKSFQKTAGANAPALIAPQYVKGQWSIHTQSENYDDVQGRN